MSCCSDSCTPVPIPCVSHSGPGPSPQPGRPSVPALLKVDLFPQCLDNRNTVRLTFDAAGLDFVQVLWGPKGGARQQFKADQVNQMAVFDFQTDPDSTYTFTVQGCISVFLSPSSCSPWSVPADVTSRSNIHSLVNFAMEAWNLSQYGGIPDKPSRNYPMSLRFFVSWSQIVPSDGQHDVPGLRAVMGV